MMKRNKKAILLTLCALMLAAGVSCGKPAETPAEDAAIAAETTVREEEPVKEEEKTPEAPEEKEWGVPVELSVMDEKWKSVSCTLRFPQLAAIPVGMAELAYQLDGSLVVMSRGNTVVPLGTPEDAFEAHCTAFTNSLCSYWGVLLCEDVVIACDAPQQKQINGNDMYRYTGAVTGSFDGKPFEKKFVGYAARMKGNGADLCFMVLDDTAEQSLADVIVTNADNMAQSLHEAE